MPSLLWQRDLSDDAAGVQNTFSSWDSCMAESYCKWPAIIGIVIGSLIVISVIWCCARCLCCGAECCCGCLSCFNRCCPSPRQRNSGYEKPQPYNTYNSQYQSPAPPMYFGGGYRQPQTATFDSPSNKPDALPAMPTWSTAQNKKVEDDSLEMEKLDHQTSAQQGLLHQRHESEDSFEQDGDLGGMQSMFAQKTTAPAQPQQQQLHQAPAATAYSPGNSYQPSYQDQTHYQNGYQAQTSYQPYTSYQQQNAYQDPNPYDQGSNSYGQFSPYNQPTSQHDYSQHQQFAGSPTSTAAPTYQTRPPSSVYTSPYAAPPSYRTAPSVVASPPPQNAQMNYGMGRKPVSGSWRDV